MSTVYSDAAGNKYLGDCQWGNHDINYPSTSYLRTGVDRVDMSATFDSYLAGSGLRYRNPPGNLWTTSNNFCFTFGSLNNNTIDDRYIFTYFNLNAAASIGHTGNTLRMYNDSGYTGVNSESTTNQVLSNVVSCYVDNISYTATRYDCNFAWVTDSNSLACVFFQSQKGSSASWLHFMYAGILKDINTNFGYYSASAITRSVVISATLNNLSQSLIGEHYIASAEKSLLQTGRAVYTIACSDGQTPTAQWATDMWVFDNNATLGYPVIGRVPTMLLGTGSYTYLKPVKIIGSVFPDNGSPWYLPVGIYAGKTLLMRCYSSMA